MSFFDTTDSARRALERDLRDIVQYASDHHPRTLQKELGPSEIGHPCPRHLALAIMDEPTCNDQSDCLPSVFGIAFHDWVAKVAIPLMNEHLGYERYLAEKRVGEGQGYGRAGSCDVYDIKSFSVIDWKCPGPTPFDRYTRKGPSIVYRKQLHTYAHGWVKLGKRVDMVGDMFMPRAGRLDQSHLWWEPYDDNLVVEVFDRLDNIILLCDDLDLQNHPERYALIPHEPTDDCQYCNWWSPVPEGPYQCKGDTGTKEPPTLI